MIVFCCNADVYLNAYPKSSQSFVQIFYKFITIK
jgi:hypothetical protein